jgi:hypothetical protein
MLSWFIITLEEYGKLSLIHFPMSLGHGLLFNPFLYYFWGHWLLSQASLMSQTLRNIEREGRKSSMYSTEYRALFIAHKACLYRLRYHIFSLSINRSWTVPKLQGLGNVWTSSSRSLSFSPGASSSHPSFARGERVACFPSHTSSASITAAQSISSEE